jgi:hypothetical protein
VKIVNLDDVRKAEADLEGAFKVFKQLPISKGDGSPSFSFRVFTIEPEGMRQNSKEETLTSHNSLI